MGKLLDRLEQQLKTDYKPTTIGYVFLKGLKNHYYTS